MSKLSTFRLSTKFSLLDLGFSDLTDDAGSLTKESVITYWKFIELSDKINQGNFALNNVSLISDSIAYFNVCNAILSYQACYDYFLQILFFGFGFNKDFSTSKQYRNLIKNDCRLSTFNDVEVNGKSERVSVNSQFANDIIEHCKNCGEFDAFYKKFLSLTGFVSDPDFGIAHFANSIKHQGGFITKELYNSHRNNNLYFASEDGCNFDTSEIYAYRPSLQDIIERLKQQNSKIVEISYWLFDTFFPKRKIKSFQTHILPKDKIFFTSNGTEQYK